MAHTAQGAVETAHGLLGMFQADRERIARLGRIAPNALRVHAALQTRPVTTINDLCARCGISYTTAARAVDALASLAITREITGRERDRVFAYDAYLNLLNEGAQPI